jgi:AcrR family transcriptional regulator
LSEAERPPVGLRERKKARTRAAIRQHALRLFRERGYAETTVDQIAAAAEVSPSTFFRYFPSKEDVVIQDDYDPLLVEAFRAQPPDLSPLRALRGAVQAVLGGISAADEAELREQSMLIFTVPELWAASLDNLTRTMDLVADLVAARIGRRPDELPVRVFAGAVLGTSWSVSLHWLRNPGVDLAAALDAALGQLEAGLPL